MLEKLLESIDKSVLTDELKSQITEEFKAAVDQKAEEVANEKIADKKEELEKEHADKKAELEEAYDAKLNTLDEECENLKAELEEAYNAKLDTLDEQCEEFKAQLEEEYQAKIDKLDEMAENYINDKEAELTEANNAMMQRAIDEFMDECYESLQSDLDVEKCKAINESFSNFALLAGVDAMDIAAHRDESSFKAQLEDLTDRYNDAVNESIEKDAEIAELEATNDRLMKAGVIAEMCEGLSLVQKDKFIKSAELVEFSFDKSYVDRLQVLKESLIEPEAKEPENHENVINENKEEKSAKSSFEERFSRFL